MKNHYDVDEEGTVSNTRTGRVLKWDCNQRYARVALYVDEVRQKWLVHRLVALKYLPKVE